MPVYIHPDIHLLAARVEQMKLALIETAAAVTVRWTQAIWKEARQRTAQPFQSTPTYLFDSARGREGHRQYPPGTLATFGRKSPPVRGTPWESRVQLYLQGQHVLHEQLAMNLRYRGRSSFQPYYPAAIEGQVGYPAHVSHANKYIRMVVHGTKKMQPRPFLQILLRGAAGGFRRSLTESLRKVVNRSTKPATRRGEEVKYFIRKVPLLDPLTGKIMETFLFPVKIQTFAPQAIPEGVTARPRLGGGSFEGGPPRGFPSRSAFVPLEDLYGGFVPGLDEALEDYL